MTYKTLKGYTYVVTASEAVTITDSNGLVLVVPAGEQRPFTATTTEVNYSAPCTITQVRGNFSLPPADGGGGGQITIDPTPTQGSTHAVSSGGVYTALQGKQDALTAGAGITLSGGAISVNANGAVNATDTKPVSGQTVNAAIAAAVIGAGGAALDGNNTFTQTNTFSGAVALNGPVAMRGSLMAGANGSKTVDAQSAFGAWWLAVDLLKLLENYTGYINPGGFHFVDYGISAWPGKMLFLEHRGISSAASNTIFDNSLFVNVDAEFGFDNASDKNVAGELLHNMPNLETASIKYRAPLKTVRFTVWNTPKLRAFSLNAPTVTEFSGMFYAAVGNKNNEFDLTLNCPALSTAGGMITDNCLSTVRLTKDTMLHLFDNLPDYTDSGETHAIGKLPIRSSVAADAEVMAMYGSEQPLTTGSYIVKGWTASVVVAD